MKKSGYRISMNEILLYLMFVNQWLMNELAETEELAEMLIEINHRQWEEQNIKNSTDDSVIKLFFDEFL